MTISQDEESPQLPPCRTCGRDAWRPGERWYFVRGLLRVEAYCEECVPADKLETAAFVQNGPTASG